MTHKLIKTDNYLLVVDDSEIKQWDYVYCQDEATVLLWQDVLPLYHLLSKKRIIAHLPLNGSPILECVDLLPPIEDDVEQMAQAYFEAKGHNLYNHYNTMPSFKEGYNKAREKYKYTEEDMRRAIEMSKDIKYVTFSIDEIIQSISQYPTEFECEMVDYTVTKEVDYSITYSEHKPKPKTTTNAQGQRVWIGKYK